MRGRLPSYGVDARRNQEVTRSGIQHVAGGGVGAGTADGAVRLPSRALDALAALPGAAGHKPDAFFLCLRSISVHQTAFTSFVVFC